jgi:hypothetical protein
VDIIVQTLPAHLTFGVLIEIAKSVRPENIDIEFLLDRKVFAKVSAFIPNERGGEGMLVIPMLQVGIDKDLDIEIVASGEGYKPQTILKQRISLGEIPQV